MKNILWLMLCLGVVFCSTLGVASNSTCYNKDTVIEDIDIGPQITDVLGCKLIEVKEEWGDLLIIAYFGLFLGGVVFTLIMLSIAWGWISS